MTPVRWFGHDARGQRLGVARSSAEHPECIDLVADYSHGRVILARMNRETWDALRFAFGEVSEE